MWSKMYIGLLHVKWSAVGYYYSYIVIVIIILLADFSENWILSTDFLEINK